MSDLIELLEQRFSSLASSRSTLESEYEEIAEFLAPERLGFLQQLHVEGQARIERRFDNSPANLAQQLASSTEAMAMPRSEPWFFVRPEGIDDEDDQDASEERGWLEYLERDAWDDLYNPASGGATAISAACFDLVTLNSSIGLILENPRGSPPFKVCALPMRDAYVELDAWGQADALFWRERLNARQIVGKWPDTASENIRQAFKEGQRDKTYEVIHAITPRWERDPRRQDRSNMPWAYVVFEKGEKTRLEEGGFAEKPFWFARWSLVTGETYGWGPGRLAMPDIRQLNAMAKSIIASGELRANPPIAIPGDGSIQARRIKPAGIVPYDVEAAKAMGGIPAQFMDIRSDPGLSVELLNRVYSNIAETFWRYLLQLPAAGPQMTATEIMERKQQFIRVAGPVFGRLQVELAQPLIERIINIKLRHRGLGQLRPAPRSLQNKTLQLKFVSPTQRALEEFEALQISRGFAEMAPMLEARPEGLQLLNIDEIVRAQAKGFGWKSRLIYDKKQLGVVRDHAAQQQALAAAGEMANSPVGQMMLAPPEQVAA